jgi:FlaA1/EpsC-like NDP-sugar epimerase
MIRLSGAKGVEIVEVGLRPGEKLYEELLMTDHLEKTENELIFIEREEPPAREEINRKLQCLQNACDTNDDEVVREALKAVVPTYREKKA